ncbi:unnamed protein product [Amaranthus hypochondriacus]
MGVLSMAGFWCWEFWVHRSPVHGSSGLLSQVNGGDRRRWGLFLALGYTILGWFFQSGCFSGDRSRRGRLEFWYILAFSWFGEEDGKLFFVFLVTVRVAVAGGSGGSWRCSLPMFYSWRVSNF